MIAFALGGCVKMKRQPNYGLHLHNPLRRGTPPSPRGHSASASVRTEYHCDTHTNAVPDGVGTTLQV